MTKTLVSQELLCEDEKISGVYEEEGFDVNVESLVENMKEKPKSESVSVSVSHGMYSVVGEAIESLVREREHEVRVDTKYKSVTKKVRPVATQLPKDCEEKMELASSQRKLRDPRRVGHKFTAETLKELQVGGGDFLTTAEKAEFVKMLKLHGKAFTFQLGEIGCVDPSIVAHMVIFTVSHAPWDLKPIPVPKALLPKLVELLKERTRMRILEPSIGPYSNRWFTVPKKSGALRFIKDMQPANRVTIRNMGSGPVIDEFAEAFAGRAIYSMGDLYSEYDQFQLNAMNKVLRDFIPEKTMPFLDDILIKGCVVEEKDETLDENGCRRFVVDHIRDVAMILTSLEEVGLTLSGAKSVFGVPEVIVVGHICGAFGRKPSPVKVDVIVRIKDCRSVTELRSLELVSWSLYILPDMDPALCTHLRTALRVAAKGEEVQMGE
ncbi:hypothetical protein R1sor_010058 [Riccia sorocarpa]|uniref:Uncharacterized protein n=1 Tax=Riccia sorocarpa TaxID=122646 RepID=A0ABD3I0J3_9MARC